MRGTIVKYSKEYAKGEAEGAIRKAYRECKEKLKEAVCYHQQAELIANSWDMEWFDIRELLNEIILGDEGS